MQMDKVLAALRAQQDEMVAIRHDLHMYPETCYEEVRTSQIVADKLTEWGITFERNIAVTGIVATIKGNKPGNRAIGLRADMDALNIVETSTFAHVSKIPGKMHGCGHDGHTTMLLNAARYLQNNPDFAGTVYCFFQPAEEGGAGALKMIEEGLFDRFPCDAVYSLHNKPGIEIGKFVTRNGPQLACSDSWTVTFKGTGGHGGAPEKSTDTTVPLAHFILGIQGIISRNVPALDSAVLSIGSINGGLSFNVMPSEIVVTGTTRCHRPEIRDLLETRLREIAELSAAMSRCTVDVAYDRGYPPLINTRLETDKAVAAASALVGAENVDGDNPPINAADDFAYMLRERPGCNVMMGNGFTANNHMPNYDFNDDAIPYGSAYWVSIVDQELNAEA
ncbi:M20 aminoacylase family protein [Ketogulonicigenium vulgare]|uniref:M20 aminoacylase family protein n=1 Tax=Ketogulonicigenium vulgare TaxID=92945 RepID=UPI002358AFB2|nr:M20 aminoacylase family protein [Ketogulonicigenium vulgare]